MMVGLNFLYLQYYRPVFFDTKFIEYMQIQRLFSKFKDYLQNSKIAKFKYYMRNSKTICKIDMIDRMKIENNMS